MLLELGELLFVALESSNEDISSDGKGEQEDRGWTSGKGHFDRESRVVKAQATRLLALRRLYAMLFTS